jgi:hypothetical protein
MGKISKKYIGDDQVGHIQLELENAGSLRAKSQDGLSSVDLLEYSIGDQLLVQQDLYIADTKDIISKCAKENDFFIQTENSSNLKLNTANFATAGNSGSIYLRSGDAADGYAGSIYLDSGVGSDGDGEIVSNAAFVQVKMSNQFQIANRTDTSSHVLFKYNDFGQAADSWGMLVQNVGTVNALAIQPFGKNDISPGPVHLFSATVKSSTGGSFTGGTIQIASKSSGVDFISGANAEVNSGNIEILTSNAYIKGTGANASSGNISLTTGTKEGTGTRGTITLNAKEVQCSAMLIRDVADPLLAQDAATKAYVDSQIAAGTDFHKEQITLSAGDIVNQYVDLAFECVAQSVMIGVGQRVNLYEGSDFTVVVDGGTGGVARVTFAGPSASAGAEALVEGDILFISFVKA